MILYTIGVVAYVLIGVFLNSLFRRIIREDSSALKFKEFEGSIMYSCAWPITITSIIIIQIIVLIIVICKFIYKLGYRVFED